MTPIVHPPPKSEALPTERHDPFAAQIREELARILDWQRAPLNGAGLHVTRWQTPSPDPGQRHTLADAMAADIRREAARKRLDTAAVVVPDSDERQALFRLCWQIFSTHLHDAVKAGDEDADLALLALCERFLVEHEKYRPMVSWAHQLGDDWELSRLEIVNGCMVNALQVIQQIKEGNWNHPELLTLFLRRRWTQARFADLARSFRAEARRQGVQLTIPDEDRAPDPDGSLAGAHWAPLEVFTEKTLGVPERIVVDRLVNNAVTVSLLLQLLERTVDGTIDRRHFLAMLVQYLDPFRSERGSGAKEDLLERLVADPDGLKRALTTCFALTDDEATQVAEQVQDDLPRDQKLATWRRSRLNEARNALGASPAFRAWLAQTAERYHLFDQMVTEAAHQRQMQATQTWDELMAHVANLSPSAAAAMTDDLDLIAVLVDQTNAAAEEAIELARAGNVPDAFRALEHAIASCERAENTRKQVTARRSGTARGRRHRIAQPSTGDGSHD